MGKKIRSGRPAGETHVGAGFDEMLKRLADLFEEHGWSFTIHGVGPVDGAMLRRMSTEQEADQKADRDAWARYQVVHESFMQRSGERGAIYASALSFARTAAKRNRDLLKLVRELGIRSGGRSARPSAGLAGLDGGSLTDTPS